MSASRFWSADNPEIMIRGRGGRGKTKLGSWSGRSPGVGWGRGARGLGILPWPYGTDALWDDVKFMVDWREMAKRANPGDTVLDETGRHEFTIPANATLSEVTGLTLTSTILTIPDSNDWFLGLDGSPTHFCIEAWVDLGVGGHAFSQIDWGDYPNSCAWMIRLSGGKYQVGWCHDNNIKSSGTLTYAAGIKHMSITSQGSWGWYHINGNKMSGDNTWVENMNDSNLALRISTGTFKMHRWTRGARRYTNENNLNPDTTFGRGLP